MIIPKIIAVDSLLNIGNKLEILTEINASRIVATMPGSFSCVIFIVIIIL